MAPFSVAAPQPGEPVVLPAEAPPVLADFLGYRGGDRYVAIYFEQGLLRLDDGGVRDVADQVAWRHYAASPIAQLMLGEIRLGSPAEDATHWLLLDRQTDRLTAGHPADIAAVTAAQPHTRDRFNPILAPGADVVRRTDPELLAANRPTDGPFWRSTLQRESALYAALDRHVERQHAAVVRDGIAGLRADVADRTAAVSGAAAAAPRPFTDPGRITSPSRAQEAAPSDDPAPAEVELA
ncbi:hypothetical protein ACQP2P_15840 [Dactylosporangium sp. CA-139114]|uniref:hypothetical protein n=1 Tax=Dactylosporangium sp. CA-139114 TaxID=3239931 RepID=UPI003D950C08